MSAYGYVHMNAGAQESRRPEEHAPLELQLQVVGSHLTWVQGTKFGFCGRAVLLTAEPSSIHKISKGNILMLSHQ